MALSTSAKAALCYVLPAVTVLGIWIILVFVSNSSTVTAMSNLRWFLIQAPNPQWYRWFLVFPGLCVLMSAAYASTRFRSRAGFRTLFALGAALAIAAWFTFSPGIAVTATLPLMYGYLAVREKHTGLDHGT